MSSILARFAVPPMLSAYENREARLVRALRLWVVLNKLERPYHDNVAAVLGDPMAALALDLLMIRVGIAWTEAFVVNPPCCARTTHDEGLVVAMVRAAGAEDRPHFDRLLAEMLPGDARDGLFQASAHLARVLLSELMR